MRIYLSVYCVMVSEYAFVHECVRVCLCMWGCSCVYACIIVYVCVNFPLLSMYVCVYGCVCSDSGPITRSGPGNRDPDPI